MIDMLLFGNLPVSLFKMFFHQHETWPLSAASSDRIKEGITQKNENMILYPPQDACCIKNSSTISRAYGIFRNPVLIERIPRSSLRGSLFFPKIIPAYCHKKREPFIYSPLLFSLISHDNHLTASSVRGD